MIDFVQAIKRFDGFDNLFIRANHCDGVVLGNNIIKELLGQITSGDRFERNARKFGQEF